MVIIINSKEVPKPHDGTSIGCLTREKRRDEGRETTKPFYDERRNNEPQNEKKMKKDPTLNDWYEVFPKKVVQKKKNEK